VLAACGARTGLGVSGHERGIDAAVVRLPDGAIVSIDASRSPDAARFPDGAPIPVDAPPPDSGTICGPVALAFGRVAPTIALVLDRSGSMRETFRLSTIHYPEPASRWEVLVELLVGPGIVQSYEDRVRFGCATYTASGSECPELTWIPPALENAAAIRASLLSVGPEGGTPTAEAIEEVVTRLESDPASHEGGAPVLLLATDGEPTGCFSFDPRDEVVRAVQRAFSLGMRTYVVSVGSDVAESHLQDVADAGLGHPPGSRAAEFWVATNPAGLSGAIRDVVAGAASCRAELPREADPSRICEVEVTVGGAAVPCGGPDGFGLAGPRIFEVAGAACERVRSGARLRAVFPCGILR
jgi:Mg-chelatase subunit ChlD